MAAASAKPAPSARKSPSWLLLALAACAVLALAGGLLHVHLLSLAAAVLLLLAWLPRVWASHKPAALLGWMGLAALLLVPAALGHAVLALMALPVVFMALVAFAFARTLAHGREPLVTRFVRVIEGAAQLDVPGLRGYTRGVTLFWACLLGAMATLSLLIALLAVPGGWLATFGVASTLHLPGSLLAWYPEAGCWTVLVAAFAGEYLFRRWYLRGVAQMSVPAFVAQLVRRWPELLADDGRA
ncbi:MAG TPA: xanthomonadin biosynthesis protein [Rhodanobacteraceae bacterium]